MRRRTFIQGIAGSAAWPLAARAHPSMPVIGWLSSRFAEAGKLDFAAFRKALADTGYVEGHDVQIECRWAEGQYDRLPALCADLIKLDSKLILAGGPLAAQTAKKATSTIPIVFTSGDDPVQLGLVASINRPGGNLTGVQIVFAGLETKKLGLLREIVPQVETIVALVNSSTPVVKREMAELQDAATKFGRRIEIASASSEPELESAFASMRELNAGGLVVAPDPFFTTMRERIVSLAARYAIPAVYEQRGFVTAGGLMSYGTDIVDAYRLAGIYSGRILRGEKPADLPVLQSTKFEFVINLKTAKALGLTVPPGILSSADEVIE